MRTCGPAWQQVRRRHVRGHAPLEAAGVGDPRAAADLLSLVHDGLRRLLSSRVPSDPPITRFPNRRSDGYSIVLPSSRARQPRHEGDHSKSGDLGDLNLAKAKSRRWRSRSVAIVAAILAIWISAGSELTDSGPSTPSIKKTAGTLRGPPPRRRTRRRPTSRYYTAVISSPSIRFAGSSIPESPSASRTAFSRNRATCRRRLIVPTGVSNSRDICFRLRPRR